MYCGLISLCNRVTYNIKSSETKDQILGELETAYGVQILQKHWFRVDEKNLSQLVRTPHLACLRSNGNPYYMYLTRYEDTPIVYLVDRKVQPGYEKPRILLVRGRFGEELFDNTLMEVEMVRDKDEQWVCLVHDLLVWRGKKLETTDLPGRLELCQQVFADHYTPDPLMDVCVYQVKRYVEPSQEGIRSLLDLSERLPYTSRGIYFMPYRLSQKPKLHNFDESLIRSVHRKVKDNPEFRLDEEKPPAPFSAPVVPTVPAPKEGGADERVLWLRKTENPDVYELFAGEGRGAERVGTARVPTMAASKMLRAVFKEATVAISYPFRCHYDPGFQKWVPVGQCG